MNEKQAKALKRVIKKLNALRMTLTKPERAILDALIVREPEVKGHVFGGGVSGAGVSGAGVSGAGVSGAGVSGAGVSGAGVSGAGVSGAGVLGGDVSGVDALEQAVIGVGANGFTIEFK